MEVLYPRCAGLDVPKATVVAAVRLAAGGRVAREVRTFATTTAGLLELAEWLSESGCTHVVMEATGVYWKPVWHVLAEGGFVLVLANAAQVRNVPGRKTDVNDATWLAELLAHGLIRASFVPDGPTEELRSLLRTRKQLAREKASHTLRLQKTLEDATVKLDGVVADLLGKSGRAMLEALVAGESDPGRLAALAHPRLAATPERLREALRGRATRHHRFLLRLHLDQVDALEAAIARVDREVEQHLAPFRAAVELLASIPGVGALAARVIVAEIGLDMGRFPTAGLLGRAVPAQRRERGRAALQSAAQGRALAQDHPGAVRLGGEPEEGQLPAGPVPPPARPPRAEEGGVRGGGLDPDRRLPHAQGRHRLHGPRARPPRPAFQGGTGPAARPPARRPRLRGRARAPRSGPRVSPVSS
jgi:transposase